MTRAVAPININQGQNVDEMIAELAPTLLAEIDEDLNSLIPRIEERLDAECHGTHLSRAPIRCCGTLRFIPVSTTADGTSESAPLSGSTPFTTTCATFRSEASSRVQQSQSPMKVRYQELNLSD